MDYKTVLKKYVGLLREFYSRNMNNLKVNFSFTTLALRVQQISLRASYSKTEKQKNTTSGGHFL